MPNDPDDVLTSQMLHKADYHICMVIRLNAQRSACTDAAERGRLNVVLEFHSTMLQRCYGEVLGYKLVAIQDRVGP
jgi:hypothetical protein